ncbi:nak mpsk protein kinase [Nannochloropsis oceanica]
MLQSFEGFFHVLLDAVKALLAWLQEALWPSSVALDGGRRVRIKKQLAEGGFGYVYLAQDAHTGEVYALKKMLCQVREQLEAAKREIFYHRELRHPNLLPLIDSRVHQQHPVPSSSTGIYAYLLFPYISGGSLRDEIDKRILRPLMTTGVMGTWPEAALLRLFHGVLLGVQALHEHKPALAHRDIKPENVLLKADGTTPILIDFGSMMPADRRVENRSEALLIQEEATQHSTMTFRAPELFDVSSDACLDAKVDVWSLGCLLFALMFGYSPFEVEFTENGGAREGERPRVVECTFLRVIGKIPWPARHGYSEGVVEIVVWMLEQDPRKRPGVGEVLARVERSLTAYAFEAEGGWEGRRKGGMVAVDMVPLNRGEG